MGLLLAMAATPLFKAADVPPNPRGDRLRIPTMSPADSEMMSPGDTR